MGITSADSDSESAGLLDPHPPPKIPRDSFHLAYVIYFTLGAGYLLPWNAFITAVDYFDYLYPDASVDRVFAIVYMLVGLTSLLFIVAFAHKWNSVVRINLGYALFIVALLAVPLIDVWYVKGRVGVYGGYYGTVAMVGLCGLADGLVQGSVVGKAGELPERYMQAVVAGTAASEQMDLRAILASQAAKDKAGKSSRAPQAAAHAPAITPRAPAIAPRPASPHTATPSTGSAAPLPASTALERKRKRPFVLTPEVVTLPSSHTEGTRPHLGDPSTGRSPVSPPRFPAEYTADTNIFQGEPSNLGFHILHSLGSAAEQQYLAASKLKPCTLEGCNDIVRGLMRMMSGLDRTAMLHRDALDAVEEARARANTLSQELAEFREVHSTTIDSLKSESSRLRNEVTEHRQDAEAAWLEVKTAKDEVQIVRDELTAYKNAEAERHEAFLKSREFQELLGPKAFKFLKIGFQSCKDQYTEAGLHPDGSDPDFPSMDKAIAAVPDDVLEDDPEGPIQEKQAEDQGESEAPQ